MPDDNGSYGLTCRYCGHRCRVCLGAKTVRITCEHCRDESDLPKVLLTWHARQPESADTVTVDGIEVPAFVGGMVRNDVEEITPGR